MMLVSGGHLVLNDGIQDLTSLEAIHVVYGTIREIKAGVINDAVPTLSDLYSSSRIDDLIATRSHTDHIHLHSALTNDEPEMHFLIDDVSPSVGAVYSSIFTQAGLDSKSNVGHTHLESDITDLQNYVLLTRNISTGTGLAGGGSLSSDLNLYVVPNDISHTQIVDIGTNTHLVIDSHIADDTIHRSIDNNGTGTTDLFSASKIISGLATKEDSLGYVPEDIANKGQVNGYAPLNANGKLPDQYLTATAISNTYTRATELAQLALTVQEGDICVRSDENKTYIALNDANASMSDWTELLFAAPVTSVNGHTGTVVLDKTDIGLPNVANSLQFSVGNNLSESTDLPTLRSNISVPSMADLTTHINDTASPHGAELSQWNAKWVDGIEIDSTNIGDKKVLVYNASTEVVEYESVLLGYMDVLPCLQVRRTSAMYDVPTTWISLLFETVDVNVGTSIAVNPTDYRKVLINDPGTYKITYNGGIIEGEIEAQVLGQ